MQSESQYTLPISIGDHWADKKLTLGSPNLTANNMFTFFNPGIIVYTDAKQMVVTAIVASWFENNHHFRGKIYGISLGDTLPKCRKIWGKEILSEDVSTDIYRVIWHLGKRTLELEFWKESNTGPGDIPQEADTVKRIKIT